MQEPGHPWGLPVPRFRNHGCRHALHHRTERASSSCRTVHALQPNSFRQMGFTSLFLLSHRIECSAPVRAAWRAVPNCPHVSLRSSQRCRGGLMGWARVPAWGLCLGLGCEHWVEAEKLERVQRRLRRGRRSSSNSFQGPGNTDKRKEENKRLSPREKTLQISSDSPQTVRTRS